MQWIEANIVGIVGFLGFFGLQAIGFVIWLTRIDDRLARIEQVGSPALNEISERLARQEERLIAITVAFTQQGGRLDVISARLEKISDRLQG